MDYFLMNDNETNSYKRKLKNPYFLYIDFNQSLMIIHKRHLIILEP